MGTTRNLDNYWKDYFSDCGPPEATSEGDLFKQVAHTICKQPIPNQQFVEILKHIVFRLQLSHKDHLLDFCCGNGLFSYELAAHVNQLTGIDFVPRNIRIAQSQKSRQNTAYVVSDVTVPLMGIFAGGRLPNKFLMNYSLAYFSPSHLSTILGNIYTLLAKRSFNFLLTGIPNFALKWNFYDTPERRARHLENEKDPANANDGLGRWWTADEIQLICDQVGLEVSIQNMPPELSNYRMDALISS